MRNVIVVFLVIFLSKTSFSQNPFGLTYPDSLVKSRLVKTISIETGSYFAGISFLSFIWYKDQERTPFHYYDDSKGYLQMDKAGHAYASYRESYSAYYALRQAGMSKKKALIFGGPIGLIFQTPIEVFDGLYEGWGFSWSDMIANSVGSALFMTQEALFDDQVILMKFSYSPSQYRNYYSSLGETHVESFFLDYNAHTYWLSGNIQKLTTIKKVPKWINLSIGYSGNGMIKEFNNPKYYRGKPFPHFERYRQYMLSMDIDYSKIETNKKWLRSVLRMVNLIKVPFPAIEYNRIEGIKFHYLYF